MTSEPTSSKPSSYLRNWLSLTGAIISTGSLFAFAFLVAIDAMSHDGNPYLGILTYLVAPTFLILGLVLIGLGWYLQRRQAKKLPEDETGLSLSIDLSRPKHRKMLLLFGSGTIVFLLLTAFGSYQTYHFTESVEFCGRTCHVVMKPEYTTYHRSSHARVSCAECHIGTGASWYVKSKISGAYQVYSTIFSKYSTPIPTPVSNLRPAQDTCERCHWPEKFTGNLDRTYEHFLSDKTNTPFTVRMLLQVGGGHKDQGFFGGIHWHMNVANKVEYYSNDPKRQVIPWIRTTSRAGEVKVYRVADYKDEPPAAGIRVMDCIDCHNRPAHVMQTANQAVEEGMALGGISKTLPNIKKVAVEAMTAVYKDDAEADAGIAAFISGKYKDAAGVTGTIEAVRKAYHANFFPDMKADWRAYPNNIGHKDWPGCFRCHDDNHVTSDGKSKVRNSDCTACHVILAQGKGEQLQQLAPKGLGFQHPDGGNSSGCRLQRLPQWLDTGQVTQQLSKEIPSCEGTKKAGLVPAFCQRALIHSYGCQLWIAKVLLRDHEEFRVY